MCAAHILAFKEVCSSAVRDGDAADVCGVCSIVCVIPTTSRGGWRLRSSLSTACATRTSSRARPSSPESTTTLHVSLYRRMGMALTAVRGGRRGPEIQKVPKELTLYEGWGPAPHGPSSSQAVHPPEPPTVWLLLTRRGQAAATAARHREQGRGASVRRAPLPAHAAREGDVGDGRGRRAQGQPPHPASTSCF